MSVLSAGEPSEFLHHGNKQVLKMASEISKTDTEAVPPEATNFENCPSDVRNTDINSPVNSTKSKVNSSPSFNALDKEREEENSSLELSFADAHLRQNMDTSKAMTKIIICEDKVEDSEKHDSLKLFLEDSETPDSGFNDGTEEAKSVPNNSVSPKLLSENEIHKGDGQLLSTNLELPVIESAVTEKSSQELSLNMTVADVETTVKIDKILVDSAISSDKQSSENEDKLVNSNLSRDIAENSSVDSDDEPLSSKTNTLQSSIFENDEAIAPKDVMNNTKEPDPADDSSLDSDDEPLSGKLHTLDSGVCESEEAITPNDNEKSTKETARRKKELEIELQNIHSETQRLARESSISLPYHKPQITSLVDFLNRKSSSKTTTIRSKPLQSIKPLSGFENIENNMVCLKSGNKTPLLSDFKKNLLKDKNVVSVTPKLSSDTEIELDLTDTPKGLNNLMTRFFKHNQKKVEPTSQDVKLHLVCKDVDKDGHENLKAQEITVKLEPEEKVTPLNTEKFSFFKGQLLSTITKKKLEKQEALLARYELDNEEGFEEDEDDGGSDCDSDENQNENESSDSEFEEGLELRPKDKNAVGPDASKTLSEPFVSEENVAERDKQGSLELVLEDSELPEFQTNSCKEETEKCNLILEDSEAPEDFSECKKPQDDMDSSFELMGSVFPAQQPGGGLKYGGCVGSDDEVASQRTPIRYNTLFSKKSSDYDSETDSPVFSVPKIPLINKSDVTDSQGLTDLLPLCSGKFTSQKECLSGSSQDYSFTKPVSSLKKNLFGNSDNSYSQNYDELLAVCSGKFTDSIQVKPSDSSQPHGTVTQVESLKPSCDKGELSTILFSSVSDIPEYPGEKKIKQLNTSLSNESDSDDDDVIQTSRKKVASKRKVKLDFDSDNDESDVEASSKNNQLEFSDDDDDKDEGSQTDSKENRNIVNDITENEDDCDDDVEDSDSEEKPYDIADRKSEEPEKPLKVTDFFDEEAELSGSDVGSDEECEDDETEQIFDDNVPSDEEMSEEELRNQIGKVHLKRMMDDDKRELRLFQEVYLEDGDLHTDGSGRERKFRWRNTENDESADKQNEEGSGDELEGAALENEKWRIERLEREKWLQEQEALHSIENWTGFKLVKRTKSVNNSQPNISITSSSPFSSPFLSNLPKSYLARNKEFCSQLTEKYQKQESEHVGRRSTKNFVFVSKSPTKPAKRVAEQVVIKEAKIRKLTTCKVTNSVKNSIFNFI